MGFVASWPQRTKEVDSPTLYGLPVLTSRPAPDTQMPPPLLAHQCFPQDCTYKAHSFPFAQLSHNTPGWRQGKTSGKGFPLPQLQAQVWKLPQRPSQQRGTHPLWVLWLWWFTLCANLARLRDPVVWSNNSLNYIQPSTDFPTPTLPFLACNPDTSIQTALFEGCGVIVIIFGNKMLETSQPWPLPSL